MSESFFPNPQVVYQHNPGGSKKWPLPPGISGRAQFSKCGRYRFWLERVFNSGKKTALWIGMNPSTADAEYDDPTVRWEMIYSQRELMCSRYLKVNVCDFRATHPSRLLDKGVEPCSSQNKPMIKKLATEADFIICVWGKLSIDLRPHAIEVKKMLQKMRFQLFCLGRNNDGSPKHPLYLRRDVKLIAF